MSAQEAFGPNLRRVRIQHGITLEQIAQDTKVSVELWEGLERNDFSRWPTGLFARSYVRDYATAIGADPDSTVDDFCRWFTAGDRRARRIVHGHAELVGHDLQWQDDHAGPERRAIPPAPPPTSLLEQPLSPTQRGALAVADAAAVLLAASALWATGSLGFWICVGVTGLVYNGVGLAALGCSPAVRLADWYLEARRPADRRKNALGLRVLRGSERVKV